jgi:hypothetical protein
MDERREISTHGAPAVRAFGYDCVIPVDGLIALGDYEREFTLILPGAAQKFKITQFRQDQDGIGRISYRTLSLPGRYGISGAIGSFRLNPVL